MVMSSFLPLRSSKPSPNTIAKGGQAGTQIHGPTTSQKGSAVNAVQTQKVSRKDKLTFFRRVSFRMSKSGPASPSHSAQKNSCPSQISLTQSDKTSVTNLAGTKHHAPLSSHLQPSASTPELKSTEPLYLRASFCSDPIDSLEQLKDITSTPSQSQGNLKSLSSRASGLFSWKRSSQSHSPVICEEEIKPGMHEACSPIDSNQMSCLSDGPPSSIMSSEISETISSAYDTTDTSVGSIDGIESDDCGLAGIGVRNRNSISLYSLPVPVKYSSSLKAPNGFPSKPLHHPGMRYAPSNSSPLSSRSHSPLETGATTSIASNLNPRGNGSGNPGDTALSTGQSRVLDSHRLSTQSRMLDDHRLNNRISTGRLNIIPTQSSIASEQLMRILRGPSPYPEETLPRTNDRNFLYVCV